MILNLPNLLTMARIAAVPILVVLLYLPGTAPAWAAFAVFTIASVTDFLDGWLARRMGLVTAFGRIWDPIADKLLVTAALFLLAAFDRVGPLGMIAALVILLREILISGLRAYLASEGAPGLAVSGLAKWKTAVQMAALALLILGEAGSTILPGTPMIGEVGLWLAAALTVITGWSYASLCFGRMANPASGT